MTSVLPATQPLPWGCMQGPTPWPLQEDGSWQVGAAPGRHALCWLVSSYVPLCSSSQEASSQETRR